jgi:DNA repair protein RecO (recombination protein O)
MATTSSGWVVKTQEYQESSKLIYMMSEAGIQSFLARGVRKYTSAYRSVLEPYQWIEVTLTGSGLPTLKDAKRVGSSNPLSLEASAYLQHLAELFYLLRETIPFEQLVPFFEDIYQRLLHDPEPYSMMLELKLLYLLGVNPVFERCVVCGDVTRVGFSIAEGGMVCSTHITPDVITDQAVIISMYQLYTAQHNEALPSIDAASLRLVLDQYYSYHVHVETTARAWIRQIFHY